MEKLNILFGISLIILLNSCIAVSQDTWKMTDGATKYTQCTDVQTDFQKSNAGKIVFSAKHVEPSEAATGNTTSNFSTSDNIYGTVFLTTCLSNYKTYMMGMSIHNASWPDGHCTCQVFTMEQQYNGSGYQQSVSRYATGEQGQIDCK